MKNGKFAKRGVASKTMVMILALVLVVGCTVGGTLAWLTAQTNSLVNTFTYGDIEITLDESKSNFKMVPGSQIEKDPKVTVTADSEACWLFVKIDESTDPKLAEYITYEVAEGWTALDNTPGVYYRVVETGTADQVFSVLANDKVTVKDSVTLTMLEGLENSNTKPTLTFTAYAVQKDNVNTAAAAWEIANPTT